MVRLAALACAVGLVLYLLLGRGSGGGSNPPSPGAPAKLRLIAKRLPRSLAAPVSGESVVARGGSVLVIGGLDSSNASAAVDSDGFCPGARAIERRVIDPCSGETEERY